MPDISNFLKIMKWLAVLKVLDNSTETITLYRLFSKDSWIWFANCRIACSADGHIENQSVLSVFFSLDT